jgi:hypothetical protein
LCGGGLHADGRHYAETRLLSESLK